MKKEIALHFIAGFGAIAIGFTPLPSLAEEVDNIRLDRAQRTVESFPVNIETARQEDKESEAYVLYGVGDAHLYLGNFEEAKKYFTQALQLFREIGDRPLEYGSLSQLRIVYEKLGDVQGLNFLESELAAASDLESRKNILKLLGLSYFAYLGDATFAASTDVWQEYLQLAKQTNDIAEQAEALFFLGSTHGRYPHFSRAIDYLQQAIALGETLPNFQQKIGYLTVLANYQRLNQDFDSALMTIEQLLESYRDLGEKLQVSKDTQQSWELGALNSKALIYTSAENYANAIAVHRQRIAIAREISSLTDEANALDLVSSNLVWLGDFDAALDAQQQALDRYLDRLRETNTPLFSAIPTAREKLAFLLFHSGRIQEAEKSLRLALEEYDTWYATYLQDANSSGLSNDAINIAGQATFTDAYRLLQQILIHQNRKEESLEASESGRTRAFAQLVATRLQGESHLLRDVSPPNIEEIKAIAKAEQTTIVEYSIIFEYNQHFVTPIGRDSSHNIANKLYIWVVKPTGEVHWREVAIEGDLIKLVRQARRAIASSKQLTRRLQVSLQKLHGVLIEPIAEFLPPDPGDRVTFIPQDILFYVPFPALVDAEGQSLVTKHTILTAPSIQVLSLSRQTHNRLRTNNQKVFIVGNPEMPTLPRTPNFPPQPLASLPGAEEEAQEIAQLFNVKPLLGSAATKANAIAQMENAGIIHIATHGILDYSGLLASLAFTPTEEDTGFLTAREIANLNLNAELVVLSACDTGRGQLYSGDGVIGLSRAFMGAGAANLIMSLWPVPDDATAVLMSEFYRSWQGGMSKAEALRQAMLVTQAQFPNPKNWAAFAIVGTGD